ncbi:hypothetical protein D9619_009511 [Psilocybe cf. subviscida]|uniref:Uncharacterized protein n=1 Tax=Psilocybe cf. subviscida TaxID=2480587 RepID=A0A8H5BU73_9AGAR|nr:hypothetical protein D9619_009511 [Psilocybe cf. subviscida]
MPALETRLVDPRPALGHVNLMVDTFIANATPDDLRSIIRNLLATGPPGVAPAFTSAARSRLRQNTKAIPSPVALFRKTSSLSSTSSASAAGPASPTPALYDALTRARSLYGAGLGFASLNVLSTIVRATVGLRWEDDGDMADILAVIDADIGQAIQSAKEEIDGNRVHDFAAARGTRDELRDAVLTSMADVSSWSGDFPFERASSSIEYWKF